MRILVLTRYEQLGSSSRVRFYQYQPYLKAQGVEIVNAPFFSDKYVKSLYTGQAISKIDILGAYIKRLFILANSSAFNLLWVEKELFPWMPAWFESLLHLFGIPYVVDYDDAVFHRYDMHSSAFVRALLGRKIDRVMQSAALVVVGNEYLAERAIQAKAQRVEYLPTVVDVQRYALKQDSILPGSPIRIGWIGTPVTAPYLDVLRDAINLIARDIHIHMVLIGAGSTNPFPGIQTSLLAWSEELDLDIGQKFDIGVMPLMDGPFEWGKCGYKLVQYMAAGLPVVASPIGINRLIIDSGKNGYLASSTDEWLGAFRTLIYDEQLRSSMGRAGRQKAEQMYNLQVTAPRLLNLLSSVRRV